MCKMMSTMQQSPTNILTWILNEIQENKDENITIVCKDGETFECSGLLLAAVSPFIHKLLKDVIDIQDCILFLPEIDLWSIQNIINRVYTCTSINGEETDEKWSKDPIAELLNIKIKSERTNAKLRRPELKVENDFFDSLDDNDNTDMAVDNWDIEQNFQPFDADVDIKPMKFETIESFEVGPQCQVKLVKLSKSKSPKTKKKKSPKLKKKIKKAPDSGDELSDGGVKESGGDRKWVFFTPDQLPKDEKFLSVHQLMKQYLQDDSIETDPAAYWRQINGLTAKSNEKVFDVIVCPQCLRNFNTMLSFFVHIQKHKLDNFSCPCAPENKSLLLTEPPIQAEQHKNGYYDKEIKERAMRLVQVGHSYKDAAKHLGVEVGIVGQWWFRESDDFKKQKNTSDKDLYVQDILMKKKHIMLEHWKWIECQICNNFMEPYKLETHNSFIHKLTTASEVQCELCGKEFKGKPKDVRKILKTHMKTHKFDSMSKNDCDCAIWFNNKMHKIHHLQSVHLKELECCNYCHYVCDTKEELEKHEKSHNNPESKKKQCVCDLCGKGFSDKGNLNTHIKNMHQSMKKEKCENCGKMIAQPRMTYHLTGCSKKSFACKECGKEFAWKHNMKEHYFTIHYPHLLKYKCEYCDKGFHKKCDFDRHQMSVHLKLRPHACRFGCGTAYNDPGNRNKHEKATHGGLFTASAAVVSLVEDNQNNLIKQDIET